MTGRLGGAVLGMAAAMAASAQAQPAPDLQVDHAAARLVVIAEPRRDIEVTVQHGPSRLPPLTIRRQGDHLIVDGGLQRPGGGLSISCVGGYTINNAPFAIFGHPVTHARDTRAVVVPGVGRVELADLPVVTAHVPLDAHLAASGAVWGEVGRTRSLALATSGCGDWRAGPVAGALSVDGVGSGDVQASDAGAVRARLAGSGDISVGRIAGAAEIALNGSGDVEAASVAGPLAVALAGSGDVSIGAVSGPVRAQIASSGDVRIRDGRAPEVQVNVSGSGDFDFKGQAGRLTAAVAGSGDVYVARVDGLVSKSVVGSGEVRVGR